MMGPGQGRTVELNNERAFILDRNCWILTRCFSRKCAATIAREPSGGVRTSHPALPSKTAPSIAMLTDRRYLITVPPSAGRKSRVGASLRLCCAADREKATRDQVHPEMTSSDLSRKDQSKSGRRIGLARSCRSE